MIRLLLLLIALIVCPPTLADPQPLQEAFIKEMVSKHGFEAPALRQLLDKARVRKPILEAIARPAEKRLNWGEYRKIFITRERIRGGLAYWEKNTEALSKAYRRFGIPPEIIVAIIGVETRYGKHAGKYPVIDALSTLGFHYPPRARFFRSELEQFLLLAREEGIDPAKPLGSYAGAMGRPQFIPSSYRAYAIDFDDDGQRDIWNDDTDVIGSVGNYFKRHGWRTGEPVTQRVQGVEARHAPLIEAGYKPSIPVSRLITEGVRLKRPLAPDMPAALLALKTAQGTQHWLALTNFYVITRYNHSPLYAMAVFQLADAIKRLHEQKNVD